MIPTLFHIYGPFYIQSYGLMIVIALFIFMFLLRTTSEINRHLNNEQLGTLTALGIVAGIIGGRIWYVLSEPYVLPNWAHIFAIWEGGFAVLGSIVCIIPVACIYLRYLKISAVEVFDIVAPYAYILQAIARVGCFCAGCCYGTPTNLPWAIMYTHAESMAPTHIWLHPTQLYSALLLCALFILFYAKLRHLLLVPGQMTSLYLIGAGTERFLLDFFRDDRTYVTIHYMPEFSRNQLLAGFIVLCACVWFCSITFAKKHESLQLN